ncbi:MAG: hypothetical protein LBM92_02525 [Opitutaceae bacterium]|jgi:uncharacterized membrane protein|nr:hypothetical protein [Opitutaceae bacterium]
MEPSENTPAPAAPAAPQQPAPAPVEVSTEDKTVAIVSYLTLIGFIVAIVMHSSKKTKLGAFHLRQTLGLLITGFALGIVAVVPVIGWIIAPLGSLFLFVCWILGFIAAIGGKEKPFPLIGKLIQQKLGGVFN